MATQITSITFNEGIMTVVFANGQQDDWNLAYVVGPVSTYSVPEPTLPDGEEHRVRSGFEVATARFVYPDEAEPRIFSADVRDVASPTYATAQDLADDITENIPTGGGGGGGGETEPAGSNTQVQFNDNGEFGASADLVFDGPILTVGGNTGDGVLELGDASGSGEVAANILNLEASVDVTASAGNKVALTTGGQERLAVDANGALLLATEPGEAGQIPVSAGPGAPVAWRDLLASGVGMSTFFFATVNGVRSLYIEVFQGVDPPNRYWSVNGVESVDNAIFGASGAWVVNEAGNTVGWSTDAVASPTLATTWTGSATVDVEPVLYGPTVQDALEQLATATSESALVGNTLFVDAVYGDNATASPNDAARPYLTCEAARDAAVAGDTIEVRPGLYDEYNLVKDGVNYYFHPGARIIYTGTPDPSEAQAIFGALEAATVSSFGVYGHGHFEWAAGGIGYVMHWQASNSVVRLYADSIASDGTDLLGMDSGVGCDIYMEAKKGSAANDAMYVSPGGTGTVIMRIDEVEAGTALMIIEGSGGYVRLIFNNATCGRVGVITSNDVSIDGRYVLHSGTSAGLSMEGGTCKINQCVIEADDDDAKSIDYLGGALALYGCTLMSGSAADSITADSARTVIAATACTTYRPIGANVTVRGNMQYDTGAAGVGEQPIANADGTWSWG